MTEDEDLLNILLWRYRARKQWCKWDPMMDQYQNYLAQDAVGNGFNMQLHDNVWFPDGIPLQFLTMHHTKDTVLADSIVHTISKLASIAAMPPGYIAYNRSWYANRTTLPSGSRPCLLV
jgi:hypothetical protein